MIETAPAGTDLKPYCEYMTGTPGVWRPGLLGPSDFYQVGFPAFNGFSVRYNKTLGAWQAVYQNDRAKQAYIAGNDTASDPQVNSFFTMSGPTPYGPWSTPVLVAEIPEMNPANAKNPVHSYSADSYATFVAERPAFETSDSVISITYSIWSYQADHSGNFVPLLTNMKQDTVYSLVVPNPLLTTKGH